MKKRDIVRRLNQEGGQGTGNGFYVPVATMLVRCNRARRRKGVVECHSLSCSPAWFVPSREQFTDVYGREIVA